MADKQIKGASGSGDRQGKKHPGGEIVTTPAKPKATKAKQATKKPAAKHAGGRPRIYDRMAIMTTVCEMLSASERGVARILNEEPGMPPMQNFWQWMDEKGEDGALTDEARELREKYARAKRLQAEYMESLLLEIADDSRNDYIDKVAKDGSTYRALDAENIQRTRVRIDTRKWLMAKLHPKKYAESVKLGGDEELAPMRSESTVEIPSMDDLRVMLKKKLGLE